MNDSVQALYTLRAIAVDGRDPISPQLRRWLRLPPGKRRFSFWVDAADIERLREIADSHPGGRTAWLLEVAVSNLETRRGSNPAVSITKCRPFSSGR